MVNNQLCGTVTPFPLDMDCIVVVSFYAATFGSACRRPASRSKCYPNLLSFSLSTTLKLPVSASTVAMEKRSRLKT